MKRVIGLQLSNCKEAERIRKGNKNLSGQGGEEGGEGETRVQNSPKKRYVIYSTLHFSFAGIHNTYNSTAETEAF